MTLDQESDTRYDSLDKSCVALAGIEPDVTLRLQWVAAFGLPTFRTVRLKSGAKQTLQFTEGARIILQPTRGS